MVALMMLHMMICKIYIKI